MRFWIRTQCEMRLEVEALTMISFGEMIHSIALTVTRLAINLQLSVFCSVAKSLSLDHLLDVM